MWQIKPLFYLKRSHVSCSIWMKVEMLQTSTTTTAQERCKTNSSRCENTFYSQPLNSKLQAGILPFRPDHTETQPQKSNLTFPPSLNHTEKLRNTSLFLAYFSFNFVQKKKKKKKANRADSPWPGAFASRGPAGSSRSWWGRGCLCACRATAWAAAPCPAGPGACVALCRRWDDPCGGTRGPWAGHKTKDLLWDSTQMHT